MLNQLQIKSIAEETNTSKEVFSHLKERIRFRRETNLHKLHNILMHSGAKIVEEEYINLFKRLQDEGAGALIIGRRGKPDRFKWYYNLKKIAEAAYNPSTIIDKLNDPNQKVVKRSRGRPRKVQNITSDDPMTLTVKIPSNVDSKKLNELMSMISNLVK